MRVRFEFVLALGLLVGVGACSSGGRETPAAPGPAATGGEVIRQGEPERTNEFTNTAREHLEQAADAETDSEAQLHYESAVEAAQQGIAADPTNPLSWLQSAQANLGAGNYEAAAEAFARAEELRPLYQFETRTMREDAWIELYQTAAPMVNAGRYEEAIPIFESANVIYDERPEVMMTLGQIYASTGNYEGAIENLRGAMEIIESERIEEMDSVTAANWRESAEELPLIIAQSLVQAQRYDEAVTELEALLQEDPDNIILTKNLATVYMELDDHASARELYEAMLAQGDLHPNDMFQVGAGFYNMEDYRAAADAFAMTAEVAPYDREAAEFWARSLDEIKRDADADSVEISPEFYDELREAAEHWLELDPNNRNPLVLLAQIADRTGNTAEAAEYVERLTGMPVLMQNLQMSKRPAGGAQVFGSIFNQAAEPGDSVTITVTFYGEGDNELGTESVTVEIPAVEATQVFDVVFGSSSEVYGYTYTLS